MGNSINETLIIWIDKNVNSQDNKLYQREIKKFDNIIFNCYESINEAFIYFKTIESFRKTIIITSGRLYEDFLKEFKACQPNLNFIPKIVIFTGNASEFISRTREKFPLNHLFYNVGGVKDDFKDLLKFIESSLNKYNGEFEPKKDSYFPNEELKFMQITDKNDLILPVYYADYLKTPTEEEIKKFNQSMLAQYINDPPISFLFSQLTEVGNLPLKLLSKFWLRAYSAYNSFHTEMNDKLLKGEYNEYLPMIEQLYDGVKNGQINSEFTRLYKGITIEGEENINVWKNFIEGFNNKANDLPYAILYGPSFFSFYKDVNKIKEFKEVNDVVLMRYTWLISLILEVPSYYRFVKNQAFINKELSYFKLDSEVLFFPFSCFEIKNIEKIEENYYRITLNYLENHTDLFPPNEKITFEQVPENKFSKLVCNSGIIDENLIKMPTWFKNNNINNQNINNIYTDDNQTSNNNQIYLPNFTFDVEKEINDYNLLSAVKNLCLTSIYQSNYTNFAQLRDIIQSNLVQSYSGNWWVGVGDVRLSTFGNINQDSVMIFNFRNSNFDFHVHVAKLDNIN